jgi:hypothetical protein
LSYAGIYVSTQNPRRAKRRMTAFADESLVWDIPRV